MSSEKNRRERKTFFYTNTLQSKTEKAWEDFDQGNRKLTVQSPVKASKESWQSLPGSCQFCSVFDDISLACCVTFRGTPLTEPFVSIIP